MAKVEVDRLHELREARGWSQETLARKAGIDPKTLSSLLGGKECRIETLRLIADALGVKPAEIIKGAKTDPPPHLPKGLFKPSRFKARLRLDLDFNSYDELKDAHELIAVLMNRLEFSDEPDVTGFDEGSVLITLSMDGEDLEKLIQAYLRHRLDDLSIGAITVLSDEFQVPYNLPKTIDSELREQWQATRTADMPPEIPFDVDQPNEQSPKKSDNSAE
jgi:transcriptional regulator with XRE-family HTH domain